LGIGAAGGGALGKGAAGGGSARDIARRSIWISLPSAGEGAGVPGTSLGKGMANVALQTGQLSGVAFWLPHRGQVGTSLTPPTLAE